MYILTRDRKIPLIQPPPDLAFSGESLVIGLLLGEVNLGVAAANKAREDNTTTVDPLGELLGVDSVDVLASVDALDELGVFGGAAANIEGPADNGAVLVQVQRGVDHLGDALLEAL